ncbi:UbiH/UbiF family hydroxylase [Xylella fastidiosa subsp. multiplex]|uniref:UbiH/UbiF family hydroxylase n=1 Tax=Xylella fastidiosa TaxID=2371 RepID=UPI002360CEA3|nr:UbiH/UbiF family hydroxylase [Xylella fastidiosa]MDD0926469.1 UbiH/UbiF family hydroxylase [Xylella fastidiosa subsp. multiplex]
MNRTQRPDVLITGGGVVGASSALALAKTGLHVALIEKYEPPRWQATVPDLRVYAFAPDSAALLRTFNVWPTVCATRAQPYHRMRIWDSGGGDELHFDAATLGREQLGWIVENALLVNQLWSALADAGVQLHCPARITALEQDTDRVRLRLEDGRRLEAHLAIAADGADSTLRQLAHLPVHRHDYAQRSIVAFVATEHPHQATAWQCFLPSGPLALLPFTDERSSIVWTLPDVEAQRLLTLDETTFARELTTAFGGRLGHIQLISPRTAFPLRRQLATDYIAGRVLTLGDAAHVVHPLAGQGVNLGLRDVTALQTLIQQAHTRHVDWATPHRLQRWARTRRSDNTLAAYTFDAINRVFSNDAFHLTLLRGRVLGLVDRLPPLVNALWRRASGVN